MKYRLTLIILIFIQIISSAEDKPAKRNTIKSNNISLGLIGAPTAPIGISYSQMLNDRVSFEMGAGIFSTGAGIIVYITNPGYHRLNPYTGFYASINYGGFPMLYLPAGLSYFGKNNFQYSLDMGLLFSENVGLTGNDANFSPWFGLKVGYRFGKDVETLKEEEKTKKKNIISGTAGMGDPVFGFAYERLITPFLGAEAGIGIFGVSAGSKFYFPAVTEGHMGFHTGITESWGFLPWSGSNGFRTYIPLGINILLENTLRISIDAGPLIWHQSDNDVTPSFSLKIGKAF